MNYYKTQSSHDKQCQSHQSPISSPNAYSHRAKNDETVRGVVEVSCQLYLPPESAKDFLAELNRLKNKYRASERERQSQHTGSISKKLSSMTQEEHNAIGREIEVLLNGKMKYITQKYIRQFQNTAQETFGWNRDDLLQHVRIAMWRGLATFDASKGFQKQTYLSTILFHFFMSLSKKTRSKKNALTKLYCVDEVYGANTSMDDIDESQADAMNMVEKIVVEETLMDFFDTFTPAEILILPYFEGETPSPTMIAKHTGFSRDESERLINSIKQKNIFFQRKLEDDNERVNLEELINEHHTDTE